MKCLFLMICLAGMVSSENITKREGETVVLRVTEHQALMSYVWMYGQHAPTGILALVTNNVLTLVNGTRFSSRLGLDISSGSMTISNLTLGDSGTFQIQIISETGTETSHYNLTVNGNRVAKPVLEGTNVTLSSDVMQLKPEHHHVIWTESDFSGKQIATWEKNIITYDPELREHLLLDSQTGSLTIHNITPQLSTFYCIRTMFGEDPYIMIKYEVEVYHEVSTLHLSTAPLNLTTAPWSCRVNCSVDNSEDVTLTLYKGNTVLSKSSDSNLASPLVLTLDISQNSTMDTFTCEAANPISKTTVAFNTTYWCPRRDFQMDNKIWETAVGCAVALIVIAAVVGVSVAVHKKYCCQRRYNVITLEPSIDT